MPIRLNSNVQYSVPEWEYCNNQRLFRSDKEDGTVCRFCCTVKRGVKACSLYNQPLECVGGVMVKKLPECLEASLKGKKYVSNITDQVVARTNPKDIAKAVLKEYRGVYLAYINAGMTDRVAHDLALKQCQI